MASALLWSCTTDVDGDRRERSGGSEAGVDADGKGAGDDSKTTDSDTNDELRLVRAVPITIGTIRNEIETSGDVEAELWADLHPKRDGFVRTLLVEEGDAVDEGALLASLDADEADLRVSTASLRVDEIVRDIERQKAVIAELEQRLEQRRLLEVRKAEEYRRATDIPEGVLSQEEIAVKRYEYEDAKVAFTGAELALRQAHENQKVTEVRLAQAGVELELARLERDYTDIRAPIPGVIAERSIRVGARIGPERKAFTLVNTDRLISYVHVPQREVRFVRKGQAAEVRCDAVPGVVFVGRIGNVSPVISGGNVKLTLDIDNPEKLLRPGMFLTIRIILDTHENAVLLPKKAILHDRDRPYVFIVDDGIARRVDFQPGYRNRQFVEALLPPDAPPVASIPVIVRGQENLKDGTAVRLEETTDTGTRRQ